MKAVTLFLLAFSLAYAQTYNLSELDRIVDEARLALNADVTVLIEGTGVAYERQAGFLFATQPIQISSASMWPAAAVVMRLVEQDKLSLDDRIGKFFPELSADKANITVRQLLSHTSGIEAGIPGEACLTIGTGPTLAQCATDILAKPLTSTPGTSVAFGGNSIQIAGRIAEIVTGKPWPQVFREELTGPLLMTRSSSGNPAFGGVSPMSDFSHFLRMLRDQGVLVPFRVLSPASVAVILGDQTNGAAIQSNLWTPYSRVVPPDFAQRRFGLGNSIDSRATYGSAENSAPGTFGFIPWIDHERNLWGVFAVREDQTRRDRLSDILPFYLRLRDALAAAVPVADLRASGVVHAASFTRDGIGPGQIVTLFGNNLGPSFPAGPVLTPGGVLAQQIGGTRVLFNGIPGPMLYASSTQISAIVPFTITGVAVDVTVETSTRTTPPVKLALFDTAPGVFTADQSGAGRAAALNQDNTPNTPARPEQRGRIVQIFLTGAGRFVSDSDAGSIATQPTPLGAAVEVLIGSTRAVVEYAGSAPGQVHAVAQINVRIPVEAPVGDAVPLRVSVAGRWSRPVTIAIR